jgi:aminoglycoside phosphotransferase (APT) family kinase protein
MNSNSVYSGADEQRALVTEKLCDIVDKFGIHFKGAERVTHAALTEVYVVEDQQGDRYILRGRAADPDTLKQFQRTIEIIETLRPLIRLHLPRLLRAFDKDYAVSNNVLWTLYPLIEGKIICSWQDSHKAQHGETERLARTLRHIQRQTRGVIRKNERGLFLDDIKIKLAGAIDFLSPAIRRRVGKAFASVESEVETIQPGALCFVHGDFHHGNVIVNDGQIVGLIDLDWCRIAHPLEDLAFMSVMTLRDYTQATYKHDDDLLEKILTAYELGRDSRDLFYDYLILCALHDVYVFKYIIVDAAEFYFKYQVSMIAELCALY